MYHLQISVSKSNCTNCTYSCTDAMILNLQETGYFSVTATFLFMTHDMSVANDIIQQGQKSPQIFLAQLGKS